MSGERHLYNVYADICDGKGVQKVNARPVPKAKAENEVGRLLHGQTHAPRAYAIKVATNQERG